MLRLRGTVFVKVIENRLRISLVNVVNDNIDDKWIMSRKVPDFYKEMVTWYKTLGIFNPRTDGGGYPPPPRRFFVDRGKTTARSAAKLFMTIPSSFLHIMCKL